MNRGFEVAVKNPSPASAYTSGKKGDSMGLQTEWVLPSRAHGEVTADNPSWALTWNTSRILQQPVQHMGPGLGTHEIPGWGQAGEGMQGKWEPPAPGVWEVESLWTHFGVSSCQRGL